MTLPGLRRQPHEPRARTPRGPLDRPPGLRSRAEATRYEPLRGPPPNCCPEASQEARAGALRRVGKHWRLAAPILAPLPTRRLAHVGEPTSPRRATKRRKHTSERLASASKRPFGPRGRELRTGQFTVTDRVA